MNTPYLTPSRAHPGIVSQSTRWQGVLLSTLRVGLRGLDGGENHEGKRREKEKEDILLLFRKACVERWKEDDFMRWLVAATQAPSLGSLLPNRGVSIK